MSIEWMTNETACVEYRASSWQAPHLGPALVIGTNDVAVAIEGTADELRAFADRVTAEVDALVGERPAPRVGEIFDGHEIVDVQDEGAGEYTIDLANGAIGYVDTRDGA